ncbi:MAG TPA: hypothetical protein VM261_39085 [Kofleriaceae bacterium]|nr:hypothetical protein [Kofleriaceae bacterium]
MRILLASALSLGLSFVVLGCSGPAKKAPAGPAADDVPQEVTCCFDPTAEGAERQMVAVDKCPEEQRNPVDACNVGPGENEKPM